MLQHPSRHPLDTFQTFNTPTRHSIVHQGNLFKQLLNPNYSELELGSGQLSPSLFSASLLLIYSATNL